MYIDSPFYNQSIQIAMKFYTILLSLSLFIGCKSNKELIESKSNKKDDQFISISREQYKDQLYGFWLAQCIANWTGLITEMDKIGDIGNIKTGEFYTRANWGKADSPNIWNDEGRPKDKPLIIDFVFKDPNEVWGADDDTDIEYIYQHLLYTHQTSILTPKQIRDGWLKHIKKEEENYLWVSNQKAFNLMQDSIFPPETENPIKNEFFDMIDAQLTTEIFGLFAPTRPDIASKIALLPIQTTARKDAENISNFYVIMHSLASLHTEHSMKERMHWMANEARKTLPDSTFPAKMFDYTQDLYHSGISWEQTRDSIYQRYQVQQKDGYTMTSRNFYCNGCFAAGINFAASLVSLFYGQGDLKETIKIGTLTGWDSDNPTATWGGLIGFMIGKDEIEKTFNRQFSNQFNIHRTRKNFPKGIDTFDNMAEKGIYVVDQVIKNEIGGKIDPVTNHWIIPKKRK